MGDLGEQDGYPVGVSNADFAAEDPPCLNCGHPADDHDEDGCSPPCGCTIYEPEEDTRA